MKKAWSLLAALPLLACFLRADIALSAEIPLPEKLHPQLGPILQAAVQQSPRMLNKAIELEMAENDRIAARAALLPTLSASASYFAARDDVKFGGGVSSGNKTSTKTPYALSLTQPLFYWGERRNLAEIGVIQKKIAEGQHQDAYRLLVQELRSTYLRLIVQKLNLKRGRYYQQYVANQLTIQEDRLKKKVISEVEISVYRLNVEQGQINLDRAQFDYDNLKRSFARLAGIDSLSDDAIADSIGESAYASAAYEQLLGDYLNQRDPQNVEAKNLRQRIEMERLNYANAKTRLRPKVNGIVSVSQDEQNNYLGNTGRYSFTSRYAGIAANWTLFDGFAAGAAQRNVLARKQLVENEYKQTVERLALDAQNAAKQISFSSRTMVIHDRLLVSNQGYLRTVQEDFKRGVKSEADVGQVQLNVYDAELNANNSRADYLLRISEFLGMVNADPILANLPANQ